MINFRNMRIQSWGFVVLALMLAVSLIVRYQDYEKVTGAQNLEASYHVLLTVTALKESGPNNHWFLPTISFGKERNKNVSWGATVPTKTGDYVYTSFTPPGFLAPFIWFKIFDLEPTLKNLSYFNVFIGSVSAIILFIFLSKLLVFNGYSEKTAISGALLAIMIAIFSREALQSHGIVYWSHSLFQLILIFSLYFLFEYLNKNRNKLCAIALIILTFAGAMTEWTGYMFNSGLILLFLLDKNNTSRRMAFYIITATICAAVITLLHYGLAVGFEPAIRAFAGRFLARSGATGTIVELLRGYSLSYGLFLLVLFTILFFDSSIFTDRQTDRQTDR